MHRSAKSAVDFVRTHWSRIGLAAVSVGIAWFVWTRPVSPDWTQPFPLQGWILGISDSNELVTIDQDSAKSQSQLQVRDVSTGMIRREFDLPGTSYYFSRITPDGKWAIVQDTSDYQMLVISLQTGQLRYPPFACDEPVQVSPDSKYATIISEDYKLIDLASGKSRWSSDNVRLLFSADSTELLVEKRGVSLLTVNLADLKERSLGEVPVHPTANGNRYPARLEAWRDGRLLVSYEIESYGKPLGVEKSLEYWSFDTTGGSLSDPRFEPDFYGHSDAESYVESCDRDGHRGVLRRNFPGKSGRIQQWLGRLLTTIKIPVAAPEITESWQALDPGTRELRGAKVEGLDDRFRISPDGQWLVDARDQLRCWQLPARHGLLRWAETLLAGLAPWGILFLRRRVRRTSRMESR